MAAIKFDSHNMCEKKGCDNTARFHGFGHDFCWQHYSQWMMSFRASDGLKESERHPQISFDFDKNS